jgi:hypothetical protein
LHIIESTTNGRAIQAVATATSGTNYGAVLVAEGIGATKNIGLYASAEGATTNVAAVFDKGNVGIGTSSPAALLHLMAPTGVGSSTQLIFDRAGGYGSYYVNYAYESTYFTNGSTLEFRAGNALTQLRLTSNNPYTAGNVQLMPSGGNVLVATTTDNGQGKLQVNGAITANNISYTGELVTTSTTFNATYYHIISGAVGSGQTYTLPSPSSNNLQYVVINKSNFSQTISAGSGFTIYNMAGSDVGSITLASKARCFIIADGSGFYQIF